MKKASLLKTKIRFVHLHAHNDIVSMMVQCNNNPVFADEQQSGLTPHSCPVTLCKLAILHEARKRGVHSSASLVLVTFMTFCFGQRNPSSNFCHMLTFPTWPSQHHSPLFNFICTPSGKAAPLNITSVRWLLLCSHGLVFHEIMFFFFFLHLSVRLKTAAKVRICIKDSAVFIFQVCCYLKALMQNTNKYTTVKTCLSTRIRKSSYYFIYVVFSVIVMKSLNCFGPNL